MGSIVCIFSPYDIFYNIVIMKKYLSLLRLLVISMLLGVASNNSFGQDSGLALLDISPSAFGLSINESGSVKAQGAVSIYQNPSLLLSEKQSSVSLGYTQWIAETSNLFGGFHKVRDQSAFAVSFYSSGIQDFEQRDSPGPSNGVFSVQYLSISAAYAQYVKSLQIGASIHYLSEEIYPYRSNGYAFNVGVSHTFARDRMTIGSAIRNMGQMEELDVQATPLPKAWITGIAVGLLEWDPPKNPELPVYVQSYIDFVYPLSDNAPTNNNSNTIVATVYHLNFGLDVLIAETLQLTSGYRTGDSARPYSFGLGILFNDFAFNYALVPFETGFGTVHSVGLRYFFP